jgi:acyl carrier protein
MADTERVEQTIRDFLRRSKKADDLDRDTVLFAGGIGLDSLATAELSVVLEDEMGTDPFSEGQMPQTVGEILDFYAGVESRTDVPIA